MKISEINYINYNYKPVFQKRGSNNKSDSFVYSQNEQSKTKKTTSQPFIRRVNTDKLELQQDVSDLKFVSEGVYPSRIVAGCNINELSGFRNCETVVITSQINTMSNFKKIVISAKSFIKNIKNCIFCGVEKGIAGSIESFATLVSSNSRADRISSYATRLNGSDIKVKNIKTNILNVSGDSSADDTVIDNADVSSSNFKAPNIDYFDSTIRQTHDFKNDGQAYIHKCAIKNLTCESLNAINTKIGTVTMNGNKTSVVSNSEIDNYVTSESDLILTNTHIKKLVVPGKNKKVYISTDDNSKIDDFKFDDKASFVIINNFDKNKSTYISKSGK